MEAMYEDPAIAVSNKMTPRASLMFHWGSNHNITTADYLEDESGTIASDIRHSWGWLRRSCIALFFTECFLQRFNRSAAAQPCPPSKTLNQALTGRSASKVASCDIG